MTFLHMHHVMANKAIHQVNYVEDLLGSPGAKIKARLRELVKSGAVDYTDRWQPIEVTDDDRELVCKYLDC